MNFYSQLFVPIIFILISLNAYCQEVRLTTSTVQYFHVIGESDSLKGEWITEGAPVEYISTLIFMEDRSAIVHISDLRTSIYFIEKEEFSQELGQPEYLVRSNTGESYWMTYNETFKAFSATYWNSEGQLAQTYLTISDK